MTSTDNHTALRSMPAYNGGYRAGRRNARRNTRVDFGGETIGCATVLASQFQAWYLGYWEAQSDQEFFTR